MKRAIFGIVALTLIFATSCKKNSSNPGGSWTFKGITYNNTQCANLSSGLLWATNLNSQDTNTCGMLNVQFPGYVLPTTGGTYTVTSNASPAGNQVAISATIDGLNGPTYISTGGNGSNQTVSVTVSNGKVSVSGSGIELVNGVLASDSSTLSLSIHQTQ